MAMAWIQDVRKTAVIDEAHRLAQLMLDPAFAEYHAAYAQVGQDSVAIATGLLQDALTARKVRAQAESLQAEFEVESGESRAATDKIGRWLQRLFTNAKLAARGGHPRGAGVLRLFSADDLSSDSGSKALHSVEQVLHTVASTGIAGFGLPPDFVEQGQVLLANLDRERLEAYSVQLRRAVAVSQLQAVMQKLVDTFEHLAVARDAAMSESGKDIPGFDLALVRGAAAGATQPAPVEPEPAPGL
jgi:hypothetical protein